MQLQVTRPQLNFVQVSSFIPFSYLMNGIVDFAIAHGNLGSCYYDLGDFASAIKSFNYAIQLEPNFADAYNNLGNALKEVREYFYF